MYKLENMKLPAMDKYLSCIVLESYIAETITENMESSFKTLYKFIQVNFFTEFTMVLV